MTVDLRTLELSLATREEREQIYAIRHHIYARELRQYSENPAGRLRDSLDDVNDYIVAKNHESIAGFVSVTPPSAQGYSIDKYFRRDHLPFAFDTGLYEVRLLTVTPPYRNSALSFLLMYAALRLVESRGARTIVAIGRVELLDLYTRVGLQRLGKRATSGALTYELMVADVCDLRRQLPSFQRLVDRFEHRVRWRVPGVPDPGHPLCYHGGASFAAIGETFDTLERKDAVISADVLDAWFDPAPSVVRTMADHLAFAIKTSPPTHAEGLQRTIAAARGVPAHSILPGAGSSALIFASLQRWITPASRVLILDPMYGEYAHQLDVIGATIDRIRLSPTQAYDIDGPSLAAALQREYDWVILVNPNSPTGRHLPRAELEHVLRDAPATTRFWIDETYVDYVGPEQSLESHAAGSVNVLVCKSLSKAYALSGVRVAYLVGPSALIDDLRPHCPPWAVSLPGQLAACAALRSADYYRAQWHATHVLRTELQRDLKELGWRVIPGCANFLLCELPADGPDAAELVRRARRFGLFVREVTNMGSSLGRHAVRIAVKDRESNRRMLKILQTVLSESVMVSLTP